MGLLNCNNKFNMVFSSAMKNDVLIYGRPRGGTAILWHNYLFRAIKSYKMENFGRCACFLSEICDIIYLIFNVYLPCLGNNW